MTLGGSSGCLKLTVHCLICQLYSPNPFQGQVVGTQLCECLHEIPVVIKTDLVVIPQTLKYKIILLLFILFAGQASILITGLSTSMITGLFIY